MSSSNPALAETRPRHVEWKEIAAEISHDAIFVFDEPDLTISWGNPVAAKMIGVRREALVGRPLPQCVRLTTEPPHWDQVVADLCPSSPCLLVTGLIPQTEGSHVPIEGVLACVVDSTARQYVLSARDVTDRNRLEELSGRPAFSDPLTGLPNRALFESRLCEALHRAGKLHHHYALFVIDLDGFKKVNDDRGHVTGDFVLRSVAERLRGCLRPEDLVARFGGDEFVALLSGIHSAQEAEDVGWRISRQICHSVTLHDGSQLDVFASIGASLSHGEHANPTVWLAEADAAMYSTKHQGTRGGVAVYTRH